MRRLIMIRHGESVGNKEKVIQGPNADYELTEFGIEYIKRITNENFSNLVNCDRIITSPLKRAQQTAEIIKEKVSLPLFTESLLTEFNPGVLGGKTHEECKNFYPEYYKIWCDRKDLDEIPGAETGEQLQARAIAFLLKYTEKESYNDIIVSHAGFLRCLINVSHGRDRTAPIEIHNGVIHVLEEPTLNLDIEKKTRAMSSSVYIVNTRNGKYVLKRKTRSISDVDRDEKRILDELSSQIPNLPLIIGMFNDEEGSSKVMKHIKGKHVYGRLNRQQEIELLKKFIIVRNHLIKSSGCSYKKIDLVKDLECMEANCTKEYTRKYAQQILGDYRNINKLKLAEYSLCHNDLNRDNILFEENEEGQEQVNFIDWEGLELCPQEYSMATFLTCSFLIEDYTPEETMKFAQIIDRDVDENFFTFLMQIRVFKGLYFFSELQNSFVKNNAKTSNEILFKYYKAAEALSAYREYNEFDINNSMKAFADIER